MAQITKKVVLNKHGQRIRMNEAALRIAEAHFGINQPSVKTKEVPIELLRLPKKIEIIKAIDKPIEKTIEKSVELPKTEGPIVEEIKKKGRKKKNEATDKSEK
jgi:hypothetical protein